MAIFSVNQVNHVYPYMSTTDGEAGYLALVEGKDYIYFKHVNKLKEQVRTDIIKKANVMSATLTLAADMAENLKQFKVALSADVNGGAPVAGQDYLLRITIPQYGGLSDAHTQIKHGVVRATSGMDAETFYTKMAESLTQNFSRELAPIFTFEAAADGILIEEVEQEWILGVKPYESVKVTESHIQPDAVIFEGEECIWGEVTTVTEDLTAVPNSKKIADLEYFSMGDRGDLYRNIGWPHVVPTNYLVDGTAADGYDIINIHYAYVGSNEAVQKSEKDLTIVVPAGDTAATLFASIQTALGIAEEATEEEATE